MTLLEAAGLPPTSLRLITDSGIAGLLARDHGHVAVVTASTAAHDLEQGTLRPVAGHGVAALAGAAGARRAEPGRRRARRRPTARPERSFAPPDLPTNVRFGESARGVDRARVPAAVHRWRVGRPGRRRPSSTSSRRTPKRSSAGCPRASTADVDRAVAAARTTFDDGDWASAVARRAHRRRCSSFADALRGAHDGAWPTSSPTEMGSPISFSQPRPGARAVDDAQHVHRRRAAVPVGRDAPGHARPDVIVRHEPVGVVAAHRAVERAAVRHDVEARARAARRVARSSSSPRPRRRSTRYLMAELLEEAGIPKGVVSVLPAGREVGEHLVRHPGVDKVAFTGSTAAGRRIAVDLRRAAQARAASSSAASRPRSSSTTPTSRPRSRA